MEWLGAVVIVAFLVFFLVRNKPKEEAVNETAERQIVAAPPGQVAEDEDLLAVLIAAVAEYEGTSDFRVLSVRTSTGNWKLTGRQELLHGRIS
jgi:hypothetical protein